MVNIRTHYAGKYYSAKNKFRNIDQKFTKLQSEHFPIILFLLSHI